MCKKCKWEFWEIERLICMKMKSFARNINWALKIKKANYWNVNMCKKCKLALKLKTALQELNYEQENYNLHWTLKKLITGIKILSEEL